MIDTDPTEFGYPANLTRLAQHFAPELWARFVDKTVSENKPGVLEQLKPETNG
jgi:predicted secreted acid phosphatase